MLAARLAWRRVLLGGLALAGLLHGGLSRAQTRDGLMTLLDRMERNLKVNDLEALQYTNDELYENRNFDKHGKVTVDETSRYETVFVEGLPYRRKVEENGKPLRGKQAAAEAKRYEETVAARRQMEVEAKRRSMLSRTWHFELPLRYLPRLFDNRVVSHEQVDGRDVVVVESTPRVGAIGSSAAEQSALRKKETTWVDAEDAMPVRVEMTQLVDGELLAGSTFRFDYERRKETLAKASEGSAPVWLIHHADMKGAGKFYWMTLRFESEQTYTNYRRFRVDVRLLDDSVEVMAGAPR